MEKHLRLRRFFRHKRAVIIPMDHPMYGGPVPGLEDPLKLIRTIANTEADGVLVSPWLIARCPRLPGPAGFRRPAGWRQLQAWASGSTRPVILPQSSKSCVSAPKWWQSMFSSAARTSRRCLTKLGETAAACETWGVTVVSRDDPCHGAGAPLWPAADP